MEGGDEESSSHVTAVTWGPDGNSLLASRGSGFIDVIDIRMVDLNYQLLLFVIRTRTGGGWS